MDIDLIKSLDNDILELEDLRLGLLEKDISTRRLVIFIVALLNIAAIGLLIIFFISEINKSSLEDMIPIFLFSLFTILLFNFYFFYSLHKEKDKKNSQFNVQYKDEFIPKVLSKIDPNFKSPSQEGMEKSEFLRGDVFNFNPTEFFSDNLIEVELENLPIQYADVLFKGFIPEYFNHEIEIFDGLFFIVHLENSFEECIIFPDSFKDHLNLKENKIDQVKRLPSIDKFGIYTEESNHQENYLSSRLLAFLDDLSKEGKGLPFIKIKENKLYFGYHFLQDHYVPSVKKSLLSQHKINLKAPTKEILDQDIQLPNSMNSYVQSLIDEIKLGPKIAYELKEYAHFLHETKNLRTTKQL